MQWADQPTTTGLAMAKQFGASGFQLRLPLPSEVRVSAEATKVATNISKI